ncbi:tetraspanin, putative [Schistosoma mansoni]|uniref:tetraspanin, putative n=1 Tax=Schistosoma mansoni TaxID=6183 RepID=UPI0001A6345C|nr:tetraspanin, putative [Schistosoma mansoni]|eukprot:XP_018644165.1 tetraspanin, putative [Schistosoma mansoni]
MTKITFTSCFKCLKYSMFVFCLIAWVLGLITFIVGIVARVNGSFGILDAHIPAVHAGANLLIAVGFFIMIMGFLGCCGAIRESQCLLFLFGCCGVTSAADYGTRSPPKSCTVTKSIQSYSRGCHEVLVEACRSNLSVICGVGISFALILISGMVFSMMLCCAIRELS